MNTTRNMLTLMAIVMLSISVALADFVGLDIGSNFWPPTSPLSINLHEDRPFERFNDNKSEPTFVLYYDLMDKWVDLDLGVDLKNIEESLGLSAPDISDETAAVLYFTARFDLSYDGYYVGANFNDLSLASSNAEDTTVKFGYQSNEHLGFEGGLKPLSLPDDTSRSSLSFKGVGIFLNGYIHF